MWTTDVDEVQANHTSKLCSIHTHVQQSCQYLEKDSTDLKISFSYSVFYIYVYIYMFYIYIGRAGNSSPVS